MTTCSCDGPPHTYDPAWCGASGRHGNSETTRLVQPAQNMQPALHAEIAQILRVHTSASDAIWYRSMGDFYAKIAAESAHGQTKTANTTEAAKYYGIADRLDSLTRE